MTLRIGFADYLKRWGESRQRVLDWFGPALTSYDKSLATTWVDRLSPESRRLLDRLSMLAPDPIPDSLLDVAVPGEVPNYDALEARAGLYAYSLIARATSEDGSARANSDQVVSQFGPNRFDELLDPRRGSSIRTQAFGVPQSIPSVRIPL